jgi:hypothetical protein
MKSRLLFFLAFSTLFLPVATLAQSRPSGAIVGGIEVAAAGDTSTVEVQAAAEVDGGKGIFITYIAPNAADTAKSYCFTIDDASTIDGSIDVLTPTFKFGPAPLTSVVRTGLNLAGVLPGEGCFAQQRYPYFVAEHPIFVPAGKFFTVRRLTVNADCDVIIGFVEAQR